MELSLQMGGRMVWTAAAVAAAAAAAGKIISVPRLMPVSSWFHRSLLPLRTRGSSLTASKWWRQAERFQSCSCPALDRFRASGAQWSCTPRIRW
ncbi:hypothetical protein [Arthrobacter sp. 92]|uniref:hypothetical protein n=1 Tax=Arthrobacter sp. 92 TaxID=3418175 RepID=UPI003D054003